VGKVEEKGNVLVSFDECDGALGVRGREPALVLGGYVGVDDRAALDQR
jgi:hypothetical protein